MKKAKDQPESEPAELASLVGERIRKIRKEEGLSLELFALRCDMNAAYVGHIERGVQNPTLNTLERICKGLDISVEDLFIDMLFTDVQRSVRLNKKKKSTNTSPYPDEVIDRQGLADHLNLDRSALSKELGKMRDEGILETTKNEFTLHELPE